MVFYTEFVVGEGGNQLKSGRVIAPLFLRILFSCGDAISFFRNTYPIYLIG